MRMRFLPFLSAALLCAGAATLAAQALPTTQPKFLQIYRERLKPGMSAAHEANESGWPQAYAQAGSPDYYLAMESITGSPEVWFVLPFESYTALDKSMARDAGNPGLSASLGRLSTADGQYLEDLSVIEAVAAPELSHGAYPDLSKMRFWNITIWRIRQGHGADFAAATAAYKKIVARANASNVAWRTYRVSAGMPDGTYIMFSSVPAFGQFDANTADGETVGKAMTAEDRALFQKFFSESVQFTLPNKFRLSSTMSYVSPEVRAADPKFWK
jgi:hypothetical protein